MEAGTGGHGARLRARDVTIHYWLERSNSAFLAVDGINLDVHEGELLSIVGPSGCGKSTFLNAVDGLLPISGGSLTLNGRAISGPGRDRAMAFQQPNLLPWRTVMVIEKGVCETQDYERVRAAGFVFADHEPNTQPLYRCYSDAEKTHFASNREDCGQMGRREALLGYVLKD